MPSTSPYGTVKKTLRFLETNWRFQPTLEMLSIETGLSTGQLQRTFMQWAGISPKAFLQAVTLQHAKQLLDANTSVLDTTYELGLSSPSRLHDLFISHCALTPGQYKTKGADLTLEYGWTESPFGEALLFISAHGLAGLAFADAGEEHAVFNDMRARWPKATLIANDLAVIPYARQIFEPMSTKDPLKIVLIGTDFEIRVWEALTKISAGYVKSYGEIARAINHPKAARAVGAAVGRNPISFVIPCHRAIGKSGSLTGYHWGLTRKRALLGWEFARYR